MDVRGGSKEIEDRIRMLEDRLTKAETDESWDALEPEVVSLKNEVHRLLREDKLELDTSRRAYDARFHWWDRFTSQAADRDRYKNTVSRKQYELEADYGLEDRLKTLVDRFYADKTRTFAREFIRVVEKVQKGTAGGWEVKAAAAVGTVLAGLSGDDGIERARRAQTAGASSNAHEAVLVAGSMRSKKTQEEAIAIALRTADRLGARDPAGALSVATMIAGAAPDDAVRAVERMRAILGGDAEASALAAAAVILSGADLEAAARFAKTLESAIDPTAGGPLTRARILAAGIVSGRSAEGTRAHLAEAKNALHGDPEHDSIITAAAILSARPPEEAFAFARALEASVRGSWEAAETIVGAALASTIEPEAAQALATHVQSELTGTWESEAWIIGAGLLAFGARHEDSVRAAYLVPGFLAPPSGHFS
jgi:hypothetical protein